VDEAERSIHDAVMVTKDVLEKPAVAAGGGAAEEEAASQVLKWADKLTGREQLAAQKFAESLETIPINLAQNAGLDPIDAQVELRARHAEGKTWYGVDAIEGKMRDMYLKEVLEPLAVKEQYIKSATEAACMLLRIDDMIAVGKTKEASPPKKGGDGGSEGGGSSDFD
jgi:chaperonin GroEL (HSP60 family)